MKDTNNDLRLQCNSTLYSSSRAWHKQRQCHGSIPRECMNWSNIHLRRNITCFGKKNLANAWTGMSKPWPGEPGVAAEQLNNFPRVTDGSVGQEEEQARMTSLHGLPEDPVERSQYVCAAHVSPYLLHMLTSQRQALLWNKWGLL